VPAGRRCGSARASTASSATIASDDSANTLRQPSAAAIRLDTGRASMMPASSPAITLPTTLPRIASGARCDANGTITWAATAPTPTTNEAARKPAADGAAAAATRPITAAAIMKTIRRRFSTTSASGTSSSSPAP